MRRTLALMLALGAAPAAAEGWSIADLGQTGTLVECMDRADAVLRDGGSGHVAPIGTWIVSGYDIGAPGFDAVITCNQLGEERQVATLVVYGLDDSDGRKRVRDSLVDLWDRR